MDQPLEKEFQYYLDHQDELVEKYKGKFIAIQNFEIIGVYNSELEAIQKTSQKYKLGTFLVQLVSAGTANYTQTYQSRVIFV